MSLFADFFFLQDWPTVDMGIKPETLQCSLCGTKLCLVAQVSACQFSKILLVELYVSHVRKMSLVVLGHRLIKLQACNSLI